MKENFYTVEDVVVGGLNEDITGKIVVLNVDRLNEEYRKPQFQLVRAFGGFGCKPHTLGSKVFVEFLEDGEHSTFRRGDFIGVLKDINNLEGGIG